MRLPALTTIYLSAWVCCVWNYLKSGITMPSVLKSIQILEVVQFIIAISLSYSSNIVQ